VNLLGHTQYLIKVPELRDLNELRAPDGSPLERGQVCPLHPRMLEVADALIGDIAPFCTAGKVHVGLDESFSLGRHPLCAAEIARGRPRGALRPLRAAAERASRRPRAQARPLGRHAGPRCPTRSPTCPRHHRLRLVLLPFGRRPRIELRNFAEYDLAPALSARGIEYWGCPMNGSFRFEPLPVFGERIANIRDWWRRCAAVGAGGMLVTSWEPDRLAIEMTTVVDAAAACLWLDPGVDDIPGMLARGFRARVRRHAGTRARAGRARLRRAGLRRVRALGDQRQVGRVRHAPRRRRATRPSGRSSGGSARRGPPSRALPGERRLPPATSPSATSTCARRRRRPRPPAQAGALRAGDPRVARGIASLLDSAAQFGPASRAGRRAARASGGLTRDRRVRGPNERIVGATPAAPRAAPLDPALRGRSPPGSPAASPVCGAWQLRFDVILTEPALQKVVVECLRPDGSWRSLHGRMMIEFRAEAARPRSGLRQGVQRPRGGPGFAGLRIAVRGIGRVGVANVELTDGAVALRPIGWPPARTRTIGLPAPQAGFPELDWSRNAGSVALRFRKKEAAREGPPP
jgi:hypothetical protein